MKTAAVPLCLACALGACGGSSQTGDGGGAAGDGGASDLGVVLTGTMLSAGDVEVMGITSDDVVAVLDYARGALAVPAGGGDAQLIDAASNGVVADGPVIFSLGHYDAVSGIGDLTIWTAAFGALPFSTDATAVFAVSDDGTRVLATQGTNSAGTATNLVVGGVDGSAPIQVAAASRIGGCSPRVGFTGGRFIASNCPPASTEVSILSIDPMTGDTAVLLTPALNYFAVVPGPAGLVAVVAPDRSGFLVPVGDAGGATAAIGQVDRLLAAPDGRAVLAATAGALRRVPTDGSAPATTLIDQGVAALQAISDDGRQVLYQSAPGTRNGYGDLLLASAVTAGAPLVLSTSLDTTTFGSAFTADGGRALYITQASDLFVGVLQSQPVGGGPPSIHGRDVWVAFAYADTRVVFDDDYVPVPKRFGRAVLRAVDTAAAAAPTVLATHAGAQIALTHARDRVVFSFDDGSGRAGLYVTPLP